jgi:hypothetical protein
MTMAKQRRSEEQQRRAASGDARTEQHAAVQAFDRLVGERAQRAQRHQGGLQVALALASVTSKVRVDTTADPFRTTPADLFARRFDDPRVGLDDGGMVAFLANLQSQLPAIAPDIAQLPASAKVKIGDVANFVGLSLTATRREGRPVAARPERAPLAIVSGPLRQAREQVRDRFGTHFAAKATDALLLAIAGRPVREGAALAIGGPAAAPAGALVVELKHFEAAEPAAGARRPCAKRPPSSIARRPAVASAPRRFTVRRSCRQRAMPSTRKWRRCTPRLAAACRRWPAANRGGAARGWTCAG